MTEMEPAERDADDAAFAKAAHEQSLILAAADRADPSVQQWIDEMQADVWDDLP